MISKHIKEDKFELIYKYFDYNLPLNISREYKRYKLVKKLNKHFLNALNIIQKS